MSRAQIFLTGFDGIDETGPGLSVARALKAEYGDEVSCTALVTDTVTPAAWMATVVERIVLCEDWRLNRGKAVDLLLTEAASRPISALIPGSTSDTLAFAGCANELADAGIGLLHPDVGTLSRLMRPNGLEALLGSLDIGTAVATSFNNQCEVLRAAPLLAYPVMASIGAQRRIARGMSDLKALVQAEPPSPANPATLSMIDEGDAFRFACLAEDGVPGATVIARVLGWTWQGGIAAASVVEDPAIAEAGHRIVEALDWTGPLELEFRRKPGQKDKKSEILLTDAQCRLPSWTMLSHWCGTNLAAALVRRLQDGAMPPIAKPRPGTMSVRSNCETTVPADCYQGLGHCRTLPASRVASTRCSASNDPAVAVTGLSASDVINPGLGVARALSRAQMPISLVGLGYAAFDAGVYESGLFDRVHLLDFPTSSAQLLDRMKQLRREAQIDALIPCLDGEIEYFSENAAAIENLGIALLLPSPDAVRRRSKLALFGPATEREWGRFSIPRSVIVEDESDLVPAVRDFGLPAVAKGPEFRCLAIETAADARNAWRELTTQDEKKMILQQRLTGPSYAVSVVCDRNHDVVSALTIKKTALCRRGSTWSGISQDEPELERAFAEFLKAIEWVGPAEGEFMLGSTGRFHLFEVNPRFTGWISCVADMGVNQPELAVRIALGLPIDTRSERRAGVFMRAPDEVRVPPTRLSTFTTRRMIRHEHALAL